MEKTLARRQKVTAQGGKPAALRRRAAPFHTSCRETLRTVAALRPPVPRRYVQSRWNPAQPAPEPVPQR
jgi:hypothetical protein